MTDASNIRWHEREFAHSVSLSWAEQEAMFSHCLWSQDAEALLGWLDDSPGDQLVLHVEGHDAKPVVLDIDPEGTIKTLKGPSIREALQVPYEGEWDIILQLPKSNAIRIIAERNNTSGDRIET